MTARIPLPRNLSGQAFTVAEARDAGMGSQRLRGGDLERPFHGIRSPRTELNVFRLSTAYARKMPSHAFFSHVTAARLWGIPLPFSLEQRLELDVSVPSGCYVPSGRGVRGHRVAIEEVDIVKFAGLRITSRARTWCDLAALLTEEALVAAGDFLRWRRHPEEIRLENADLAEALDRFRSQRGRSRIVVALPRLTDRADSPPESIMRVRFEHSGLPAPEVNEEVYDAFGRFVGMPDLMFRRYRVAFDYEGDVHRADARQWAKDLRRAPRFEDAGWSYVRGGAADLRDSTEIIELLGRRLRARGWVPLNPGRRVGRRG